MATPEAAEQNSNLSQYSDGGLPPTHDSKERKLLAGKVAIVTGGSRDMGAGLVRKLVQKGIFGVVVGLREKISRAERFVAELGTFDAKLELAPGDITTEEGIDSLDNALQTVAVERDPASGKLNYLFINAAGNNRKINVESTHALIDRFLPQMAPGGKIVFMQSVPGHYYSVLKGTGQIPDIYNPVAETKDEGEQSLDEIISKLEEKDVSLIIAVVPALPETTNIKFFSRADAEAAAKLKKMSDMLGLLETMAINDVAEIITDLLSKKTGGVHLELFGPYLDGRQVLKTIYGEPAIYVDVKNTEKGTGRMIVTPERASRRDELRLDFVSSDGQTVVAELQVEEVHVEGHFTKESGLPPVLPGHKHIRTAVETMIALIDSSLDDEPYARLIGFDQVTFMGPN